MSIAGLLIGLLFTAATFAQSIVTPVFVHQDGDASAIGYTGSDKEIVVDGGSQQNVGWITFQTQGIDFSKIGSAKLSLYVKSVTTPGTLQIRLLTSDITAPENNVKLSDIPAAAAVTDSIALKTSDVEKMIQLDLTTVLKAGAFKGVALTSVDGLNAAFDSKEGHLAPVILLTHNVDDVAAKWLSGSSAPANSLGKDGDYYLNTASGDVSAKSAEAWSVVANVVGSTGAKGDKGDQGIQGIQGPVGATGANGQSPATTSTTSITIASSGSISITLADNRLAFGIGQRIRIASTAGPINFMEGAITAYNSTTGTATVALDNSAGSGTGISAWTVTVTGTFPSGTAKGDMQYWDGTKWVRIVAGGAYQVLSIGTDSIPVWRKRPLGSVMDIDGNVYQTVVIGNQEWTFTNLRTTHYNDGTSIQNITDGTTWSGLTTGAYCYYNNTTDAGAQLKYGALYNWYAVGTGKLVPAGWRVPDTTDWNNLENYLISNGYNYDESTSGNKIAKSMAAGIWDTVGTSTGDIGNNLSLNNKSGFSALGGGYRYNTGNFYYQCISGFWWSASEYNTSDAWYRLLNYDYNNLLRGNNLKSCGFSVRLVRDIN